MWAEKLHHNHALLHKMFILVQGLKIRYTVELCFFPDCSITCLTFDIMLMEDEFLIIMNTSTALKMPFDPREEHNLSPL